MLDLDLTLLPSCMKCPTLAAKGACALVQQKELPFLLYLLTIQGD